MYRLTQGLHRAVQVSPNAVATVDGARQRTYAELVDRVARLAGALQALGMGAGDRVALMALNSDRYLEYLFAVPWGGGVAVPVNWRWAGPETVYCLNDSGSTILIVDHNFAGQVADWKDDLETVQHVVYCGDDAAPDGMLHYEEILAAADPAPDTLRAGDDLAGIFYTGGTTGRSKGVMLSHNNIIGNAMNTIPEVGYDGDSVYLHCAPMFHLADGASTSAVTMVGGRHVFLDKFDPVAVMKTIAEQGVTNVLLVPTMIQMVVDHPDLPNHDLSGLRQILYGASVIPEAVLRRGIERLPHTKFCQAYGMTELSPIVTIMRPEYHTLDPDSPYAGKLRSAGRCTFSAETKIVDEDDNEVPRGTVGEVCARGIVVMQGYWNKPEETAHALRNGWMHTGDGGYMDEDGFVFIVDRVKDMIISGGENIYSAEVENAVATYPGVLQTAVIGIPSEQWGEAVHAIVVLKDGADVTEEALIAHVRSQIAGYKVPRSVEFCSEPLPLSGAGKILKTELRKPFWEGVARGVN